MIILPVVHVLWTSGSYRINGMKGNIKMAENTKKKITLNTYVPVVNGTAGTLVYVSKHTGEEFVWEEPGDTIDMQVSELKAAKASNKKFFIKNWFMLEPDVIEYLGLQAYYKNTLEFYSIDTFFEKNSEEMKKILDYIPEGQKETLKYMARSKVANGEIDSLNVIHTLEELLDIKLIEKVDA